MKITKYKSDFTFILLMLIIAFAYNTFEVLQKPNYSSHQWRQADCLSITNSYYEDDAKFLEPSIQWVGRNNDSKTISEFPIIYYSSAQIWKLIGKKEGVVRLINLSIVLLGIFLLYKSSQLILKDNFWAYFIAIFLYSSHILVYYSNNFLMNAPAFGFALIGGYFFLRFYIKNKYSLLYLSMLFFLLGGLLKVTSLILFTSILGISFLSLFNIKILNEIKTPKKILYFLPFLLVIGGITAWYKYAGYYNSQHLSGMFLQRLFPIWEISPELRSKLFDSLFYNLLPNYFNKKGLLILSLMFLYLIIRFKKTSKLLLLLSISVVIGSLLYVLLWYQAFDVHDYYLINLLIIIPIVLITFIHHIKIQYPNIFTNKYVKLVSSIILIVLIYNTAISNRIRYDDKDFWIVNSPIIKKSEKEKWHYYHYRYSNTIGGLRDIEPYLEQLGIHKNDTVVSLPDHSINITLFQINRKGFSGFGYAEFKGIDKINYFRDRGAKYFILNNPEIEEEEWMQELISRKIGTFKNVSIYDIQ